MRKLGVYAHELFETLKKSGVITQIELAERMGCAQSYLSHLLSGERRWNEDWIDRFCEALGITLSDLLREAPEGFSESKLYPNPKHARIHKKLQWILEKGRKKQEVMPVTGSIEVFFTVVCSQAGEPEWMKSKVKRNKSSHKTH